MRLRIGLPAEIIPIFWGLFFIEGAFGAYLSIWPLWIEHLGAPLAVVGFVLGSSGFLRLFVIAPSSAIAERFGYRRSILICRASSVVGLLAAALATRWWQLVVMLVCSAVGELVFPLTQSLVATLAGDQRMRSFALVFTVGPSVALTVAPLLSGGLVELYGMRAGFLFAAACTFIALLCFTRIHEPEGFTKRTTSATSSSSTYRDAFAVPIVRVIICLLFATVFVLSLGTSFISPFLEDVRGISPSAISVLSAAAAVGSACFGLAVARIHRLQRAPFVVILLAIAMAASGFFIFRITGALAPVAVAFFCRGGLFSAWAMHSAALGEFAPAAHRVRAFALVEMSGGIAYSLGPMVAGPLYVRHHALPFDLGILLSLCLIPVMLSANRWARALHRARIEREPEPTLAA